MKRTTTILLLLSIFTGLQAQMSLYEIDIYRIPQKKVKKFIKNQLDNEIIAFSDLIPSCPDDSDLSDFSVHEKIFTVDTSIAVTWENYINANPTQSWESRIVSFGVLLHKNKHDIVYRNENYSGIDTGQVYFLNLRIFQGIYNLAVAFEVVDINMENRTIEFSYIEGGKALGRQQLKFHEMEDGSTEIIHTSSFKSESNIRDKFLYPFFHERSINQFHKNMARMIAEN
jgi:hypothetical protein